MRHKISIIGGAGNVGSMAGLLAAQKELGDVILLDIPAEEGRARGKALDMSQMGPLEGFDARVTGTSDYADIAGSDLVIVTAGLARKPGMSREDLLLKNAEIIREVGAGIRAHAPGAIVLVVSNPIDVMAYLLWKVTGFPEERVIGQAGVLDSSRFRTFIAQELNCSVEDVSTMVLGGHGDSMVPLVRYTSVAGIPLSELLPADRIAALVERTRHGGAEIVQWLGTGSAYYAPGAAVVQMAEAILKDKRRILPCSAHLNGQYGIDDLYIGVPVLLGAGGLRRILELPLEPEELAALRQSAAIYRQHLERIRHLWES
jgi:malate dehydrogenase